MTRVRTPQLATQVLCTILSSCHGCGARLYPFEAAYVGADRHVYCTACVEGEEEEQRTRVVAITRLTEAESAMSGPLQQGGATKDEDRQRTL